MSAHWPVKRGDALTETPLRRVGLGTLLHATAARHPDRIALVDPADKAVWTGRPAITLTYAAAAEIVTRLAHGLRGWRLPPGSRIGLCLPGNAESALALLAVEASGHVACALPVAWDEDLLAAAVQGAGIAAVITQSRLGSVMLAERFCAVAARNFGLRYLAAFGPDVPDGVINLDPLLLAGCALPEAQTAAETGGLVTFAGLDPGRPFHRSFDGLIAAAAVHLLAVRAGPDERILSLLGPHDLRGLATGLAAALIAGASLETLPLFDGAGFATALARPVPTHLVAPAFLESNLHGRAIPASLRSLSVVHRAPARLFPKQDWRQGTNEVAVVDTLVLDEVALLSGRRGHDTDPRHLLAQPDNVAMPGNLLALRREADGRLAVRGKAAAMQPLQRGNSASPSPDSWHATPYGAVVSKGIVTAVDRWEAASSDVSPESFASA